MTAVRTAGAVAGLAALFLVDIGTPVTLTGGLLYLPVVVVSRLRGHDAWVFGAVACCSLGVVDACLHAPSSWTLVSEGLALAAVLATASGTDQVRRLLDREAAKDQALVERRRELEELKRVATKRNQEAVARGRALASMMEDLRCEVVRRQQATAAYQRQSREMEELVFAVSHDLRQPLATLGGFSELLVAHLDSGDPERARDAASRIRRNTNTMDRIIDDLMELNRVGARVVKPRNVRLGELLDEARLALAHAFDTSRARLVVDAQVPTLIADPNLLLRALLNLMSNALKYACPTPGLPIRVGSRRTRRGVGLFVEDRGPGVPPALREQVFERHRGTESGLGLAIVRRIARLHDGWTWVEDAQPLGARFWLELPLADPWSLTFQSSSAHPAPADQTTYEAAGWGPRILVIEDDDDHAELVAQALRAADPRAWLTRAASGEAGLDTVCEEVPDLVLLDIQLPGLSGYEVLAALRRRQPLTTVPVVMMSAAPLDEGQWEKAVRAQPVRFVRKPTAVSALATQLQETLAWAATVHQAPPSSGPPGDP